MYESNLPQYKNSRQNVQPISVCEYENILNEYNFAIENVCRIFHLAEPNNKCL